jgi:transcriptional regulator with XRE-family HTH domain
MARRTQRRPAPMSFADRVNHLFATVRTPDENREYTNAEVAQATGVSATYIGYLRKGVRGNPSVDTVRALARFFRVRPSYLVDEEPDEPWAGPAGEAADERADRRLAEALRNPGITRLAMRAAEADLSPAAIAAIAAMIDEVEKLEQAADGRGKRRPTR